LPASCGLLQMLNFPCGFKVQKKRHVFKKKTEIPFSTIRKMFSSCGFILEQKQKNVEYQGVQDSLGKFESQVPRFQGENPSEFITETPS